MSKSGNGEIIGIDPAAIEAAIEVADAPVDTASYLPADTFVNSPGDAGVGMAAPQEIPPVPAMSAIEEFYGSPTRITQPDAGYFDEFPLPGQAPAADSAPQDAPYVPPDMPYVPPDMPYVPLNDYSVPSEGAPTTPYVGLAGFDTFDNGRNFIRDMFLPDMNQYITAEDLPTFQEFDPTQLQDQINQLALAEPMNTSQFLTAADLPTYDTSQFLTTQDLPTYQQFDPTYLEDQINEISMARPIDTSQFLTMADLPTYDTSQFLTAADLPTYQQFDPTQLQNQINELAMSRPVDTSQFLTAADLPTYQQFDSSALEKELADLRAQVGLLGQAPNQSFAQTQPYAPILDFAVR
jgi:hypothetical protein